MAVYGSSKSNRLAIVEEVTPGTLVDPSSGTDFVSMQPDFSLTPAFDKLDNEEIRASIGAAKPIQGLEKPNGAYSHYLKASGVEGQAPEFDLLLKSVFGTKTVNSTQRTTTTSSTVSLVKLGAGGSDFSRGMAMLIKDGTNGYSIRNVLSMSTNDATLAFNLANAPATGIGVGKCVSFAPANSGHPSLSVHSYRGNGQLYEALAGAKVSKMTISAKAGSLINSNFTFEGTKYCFDPIRITSSTKYLDFDIGGSELHASVAVGVYRDPHELAQAIQDAMNSLSADLIAVSYYDNDAQNSGSKSGKFKISSAGGELNLLWNTGVNTANTISSKIGFSSASDDTSALTYDSDTVLSWVSPYTPSLDASDPLAAKNQEIMLGDSTDYACFCAQEISFSFDNTLTDVLCICSESGVDQKLITARKVSVEITALIDKNDAQKFKRYRSNSSIQFAYNFGVKSGGNWVPGQCGNLFMPTAVVSGLELQDLDTVIGMKITLDGYVDANGNGEVYLNFL